MFHPSFINAASAFPFGLQTTLEPLTPRSPFSKDGSVFFYPPSSPSCSSGGIPSPRLLSPSVGHLTSKKSSFTIEAILGLKAAKDTEDVFRQTHTVVKDVATTPSHGGGVKRKSSSSSDSGGGSKAKRIRTIFTPEQLERLEAQFERQQYMVGPERLYLAASLNLSEAQVKVWFQNRRIKWRKTHLEQRSVSLRKNSSGDDLDEITDLERTTEGDSEEEKEFEYSWVGKSEDSDLAGAQN